MASNGKPHRLPPAAGVFGFRREIEQHPSSGSDVRPAGEDALRVRCSCFAYPPVERGHGHGT